MQEDDTGSKFGGQEGQLVRAGCCSAIFDGRTASHTKPEKEQQDEYGNHAKGYGLQKTEEKMA
jgi:hypothetical protein